MCFDLYNQICIIYFITHIAYLYDLICMLLYIPTANILLADNSQCVRCETTNYCIGDGLQRPCGRCDPPDENCNRSPTEHSFGHASECSTCPIGWVGYDWGLWGYSPWFVKGELLPNPMVLHHLKIINTFLKNDISILKQIVWQTQIWHWNFSRFFIDQNVQNIIFINNSRTLGLL